MRIEPTTSSPVGEVTYPDSTDKPAGETPIKSETPAPAEEEGLQGVALSEDNNAGKESVTSELERKAEENIKRCYEQIDILRNQLNYLDGQARNLLAPGADMKTSDCIEQMQKINSQKNEIYENINSMFLNIMEIEQAVLDAKMQSYTMQASAVRQRLNSAAYQTEGMTPAENSFYPFDTAAATSYTVRQNAAATGNAVIGFAMQFDDKTSGEMKGIMQGSGSAYHENAWCADFVSFALKGVYGKDNAPGDFFNTCANTAHCPTIHSWAKSNGSFSTDPNSAAAGDIVIFDWNGDGKADHVGLFIQKNENGTIQTVEGNTWGVTKSCVESKARSQGTILGYVRLSALE